MRKLYPEDLFISNTKDQSVFISGMVRNWSIPGRTQFISVSRSVVSDSLQPHGQQHTRPPCPSPNPGVYSNSCPVNRWCHPTISSSVVPLLLPLVFPSMRVFSNESVLCIRWPKYWSFTFRISPSSEYSGLISFRMDLLDLLAVQGALNLQCSAFFIVQLSHLFILSGVISPLISSSMLGTYWPGEFIIHCPIFLPFHIVHEVLKARILVPFPVDSILLELSTMTCPSWVALQGMAHSFSELDKAVVHVIRLFSFLWLWFSFCLSSDGEG